jgi:hypothetical protein
MSVLDHDPSEPREPTVTMKDVQSLLGCAQRLVDSRPSRGYPVAWCVEAAFMGDLGAVGTAAAIAARSTPTAV